MLFVVQNFMIKFICKVKVKVGQKWRGRQAVLTEWVCNEWLEVRRITAFVNYYERNCLVSMISYNGRY